MNVFTILHISDLHRSRDDPVDNDTLVAALLADRDRYIGETPAVSSPDAIVVSGDLIQGVPIGSTNCDDALRSQYQTAGEFLDQLVLRFLAGDRSRVILVPGNHDVCWNTSYAAMERVRDGDLPKNVRDALVTPDSNYRWSWSDRALFKIKDAETYRRRLDYYWEFAEKFYKGVALPREIDRNRGYQLFELCDRRIVVAAFDSISGNDCFNFSGSIPRGAAANCELTLRDMTHTYDLRAAVWHHSTHGPPLRDDYMDVRHVYEMAGLGFQLGIHGHQHVASTQTHYVHLSETQSMAVVSAGSLCAGAKELPRGVNRQYNLIVLEDNFHTARVHVREIVEGEQFCRKNNGPFLQGSVALTLYAPTDALGRVVNVRQQNTRTAVLRAEEALNAGRPDEALKLLEGCELPANSHARRIGIKAAMKLDNPKRLMTTIGEPQSEEEAVIAITAMLRINVSNASAMLNAWPSIDPATRAELVSRLEAQRLIQSHDR